MAKSKTTAPAPRKSTPVVSLVHQPITKPRNIQRAHNCQISPEDKMAIIALNIETTSDEFIEKATDLYLSAGMTALFDKFVQQEEMHEGSYDHIGLASFTATVLEAAKRCGIA